MIAPSQFRRLVDEGKNPIEACGGDIPSIYEVLGISPGPVQSLQIAQDHVLRKLRAACLGDLRYLRHELRKLRDRFITENVLQSLPLQPYISILLEIEGCLRDRPNETAANHPQLNEIGPLDWSFIVELARTHLALYCNPFQQSNEDILHAFQRPTAVSEATARLGYAGFTYVLEEGVANFERPERERIVRKMEDQIAQLGGANVAAALVGHLRRTYSPFMQRYLFGRRFNTFLSAEAPQFPIGYLLQLCVKHFGSPAVFPSDADAMFRDLCQTATDFASIYDVQSYHAMQLLFNDRFSLSEFVTELALHDRFYLFRQFRASDLRDTIVGVFDWVDEALEKSLGWSLENAALVCEKALSANAPAQGPAILSASEIIASCSTVPPEEVKRVLQVLTHTGQSNEHFVLPESGKELTFTSKPLMAGVGDHLLLLDTAICTPAVFEALATALLQFEDETFEKTGFAVERFLSRRMRAKGVKVISGHYFVGKQQYECDAIVETADTIIFLELKIKSLTRRAQSGSDLDLFVDLAKSLLAATVQLNRHELAIRDLGTLSIAKPNEDAVQLTLGGRSIEKVALTFDDFGSFQDRNVLSQLLGIISTLSFGAVDPARESELKSLNKSAASLREQIQKLVSNDSRLEGQPFFNCWFLSVPQMLVLLDNVSSAETFKSELWRCRHMTTGSLDWYFEYEAARRILARPGS